MKILYYTVEKEIDEMDFLSGQKNVIVYEIKNDTPIQFFALDLSNEDESEEEIQNWLNDNGYGDDEYKLVHL